MHASLELYANLANITGPQAYESTHTHTHTFRPQSPTHIPSDNNGKHFAKCKRPRRTVTGRGRLSFAFKVLPYGQQRYVLLPQSVQPYEVSSKKVSSLWKNVLRNLRILFNVYISETQTKSNKSLLNSKA